MHQPLEDYIPPPGLCEEAEVVGVLAPLGCRAGPRPVTQTLLSLLSASCNIHI